MTFDWREYVELAKHLAMTEHHQKTEAAHRSATSRAYYSAFCFARNYARDNLGFQPTGSGEDHRLVRVHYEGKEMEEVSNDLLDLMLWRNECDYDDSLENLEELSSKAILTAERVIAEFP